MPYENMMQYTKLEVPHCRQRKTELQQRQITEKCVKSEDVVSETREPTHRQTSMLITILCPDPGSKLINKPKQGKMTKQNELYMYCTVLY